MKREVVSVAWHGHTKTVRLAPDSRTLTLPLSACVTKGDQVRLARGSAWVVCSNGECKILRPYFQPERLRLGAQEMAGIVKEVTDREEHRGYESLATLHYRGHVIHGRTARLILRTYDAGYPAILGYVELATPFYMSKPRNAILAAPFECNGIAWRSWGKPELRKYIHLIVRIARVVVTPELRGLGLAQALIKHAIRFARERWQVSRYLPYFAEISADMLRYVPFADRAGMIYVGETEGNLSRVAKDMRYLIGRFAKDSTGQTEFEKSCGICDKQVARMTAALELMKREGLSADELVDRLRSLSPSSALKEFALLHQIVTLPKPHYMIGLRPKAQAFIEERARSVAPSKTSGLPGLAPRRMSDPIRLEEVRVSYLSRVRRTKLTHAVQHAFGLAPDEIRSDVVRGITLEIAPREVVLVVGPSGSGKTSLLRAMRDRKPTGEIEFSGRIYFPKNARLGWFRPIRSRRPMIEVISPRSFQKGLLLLGMAGLSEAYLYLKRFDELSAGQQYRAMLAQLIASDANMWLADEFCANLDPMTANAVAHKAQRVARMTGASLLVAAPHTASFVESLAPDKVVVLTAAWEHSVVSGDEYQALCAQAHLRNGHLPRIRVPEKRFAAIQSGRQSLLVRRGRHPLPIGTAMLERGSEEMPVRVVRSEIAQMGNVSAADAKSAGEPSRLALAGALREGRGRLADDATVTIIHLQELVVPHERETGERKPERRGVRRLKGRRRPK